MKPKSILIIASILGFISVALGAMGAHALKSILSPEALDSFSTGVRYQMFHTLLLVGISANLHQLNTKWITRALYLIIIGTLLFSGSIYLLSTASISGISFKTLLGPITPIGGLLLLMGWISVGMAATTQQK